MAKKSRNLNNRGLQKELLNEVFDKLLLKLDLDEANFYEKAALYISKDVVYPRIKKIENKCDDRSYYTYDYLYRSLFKKRADDVISARTLSDLFKDKESDELKPISKNNIPTWCILALFVGKFGWKGYKEELTVDDAILKYPKHKVSKTNTLNEEHAGIGKRKQSFLQGRFHLKQKALIPILYSLLGAIGLVASIYLIRPILIHDKFNCHFFEKKQSKFKILILPFEVIGEKNNNRDIGSEINQRQHILNQKNTLNTYSFYDEVKISKNFSSDSASDRLENCSADLIIYGSFREVYSSKDSIEIDYNWILSDKFDIDTFQLETKINPQKSRIQSLRKGHLQGGTDYIVYFTSSISAYFQGKHRKTIDLTDYINDTLKIYSGEVSLMKGNALSQLGYYKKAHTEYENGLKLCIEKNDTYWLLLSNISVIRINKLGEFDVIQFENQLQSINELKKTNSLDYVNHGYINLVTSQIKTGLYKEALQNAIEYKTYFEKQENRKPIHEFSYYRQLAIVYEKIGNYIEAVKNYENALSITKKHFPLLKRLIISDLIICNQQFGYLKEVDKWNSKYTDFIDYQKNNSGFFVYSKPETLKDSLDIVTYLLRVSKMNIDKGAYSKALSLLNKALRFQTHANSKDIMTMTRINIDIAICLEFLNEFDNAYLKYSQSIPQLENVLGKKNFLVMSYKIHELTLKIMHAESLRNRNWNFLVQQSKSEIKKWENNVKSTFGTQFVESRKDQLLKLVVKKLVKNDLQVIDSLLSYHEDVRFDFHYQTAELQRLAALGYEFLNENENANKYYQKVFNVYKVKGIEDVSLAKLHTDYAVFLLFLNKRKYSQEIRTSLNKSLKLKKKFLGKQNQQLLITYYNLLLINEYIKEYDRISDLIDEIEEINAYRTNNKANIEINRLITKYKTSGFINAHSNKSTSFMQGVFYLVFLAIVILGIKALLTRNKSIILRIFQKMKK